MEESTVTTPIPENESGPATCPPGRLPGDFLSAAERIQRRFLDDLSPALAAALETSVETIFAAAGQSTFEAFIEQQRSAGCVIALDLAPLGGCALISFSRGFLFKVLDIFMATPASAAPDSRETLTAIELHVLQELFDLIAMCLRRTWQATYPVAFGVTAVGAEKCGEAVGDQAAQTAVVLRSQVYIDGESKEFQIALPGFLFRIAEREAQKNSGVGALSADVDETLLHALGAMHLELEVVLNGSKVSVADLLHIRPGQIMSVATPADSLFECRVNGSPKFKGEMVTSGGRPAFRLLSTPAPSD